LHGHDKYKRTVGEVILPDGMNLNQELVRLGWCWWYRKYADTESLSHPDVPQYLEDAGGGQCGNSQNDDEHGGSLLAEHVVNIAGLVQSVRSWWQKVQRQEPVSSPRHH
jgi:endonuclease YncB( thermonuclease family)